MVWDGNVECGSLERGTGAEFLVAGMTEILMGDKVARWLLARLLRLLFLLSVLFRG